MKELPTPGDIIRRKYTQECYLVLREEYSSRTGQLSHYFIQCLNDSKYYSVVYHDLYTEYVEEA
jgi:hypothetical protein